jgi:hypothetical protein
MTDTDTSAEAVERLAQTFESVPGTAFWADTAATLRALLVERDRLRAALQDMLADREAWQIGRDTRDRARAALKETGHE